MGTLKRYIRLFTTTIRGRWPAFFGVIFIVLVMLTAILGYAIMPDKTTNANDGSVLIQKMPPGFSAQVIKQAKNARIAPKNWIEIWLSGKNQPYTLIPLDSFKLDSWQVIMYPYRGRGYEEKVMLVDVLYPLAIQDSVKYMEQSVTFKDIYNSQQIVTIDEAQSQFYESHLQKRTFLLGTDRAGRDILSRLIYGSRISLSVGIVSVIISVFLGILLGALSGYFGGFIDKIIMWFMTVTWSIPGIMLVIAISLALNSKGLWVTFVAVGVTMWVDVARVVRGQFMELKQKTFIEAAIALGYSDYRIIFHHILPNVLAPVIVIATGNLAGAILLEAGLSFLGLSVQPPTPSWGMMIYEGFNALGSKNSWHLIVFPSLAISLTVLSFNLFGNGLRDYLDPNSISTRKL